MSAEGSPIYVLWPAAYVFVAIATSLRSKGDGRQALSDSYGAVDNVIGKDETIYTCATIDK